MQIKTNPAGWPVFQTLPVLTQIRQLFQGGTGWEYDLAACQRYLNGEAISAAAALEVLEAINATLYKPTVETLAAQLANQEISLASWQTQMSTMIKEQHIQSAIAGRGSRELMTQVDWGRTGGRLKYQYEKLDGFARAIESGHFSEEYIAARSKMYINSTRTAYWDTMLQSHQDSGLFSEERRFLGVAEHCSDCEYYSSLGWQKLGSLPAPGQESVCLTNCQCTKEFQ